MHNFSPLQLNFGHSHPLFDSLVLRKAHVVLLPGSFHSRLALCDDSVLLALLGYCLHGIPLICRALIGCDDLILLHLIELVAHSLAIGHILSFVFDGFPDELGFARGAYRRR